MRNPRYVTCLVEPHCCCGSFMVHHLLSFLVPHAYRYIFHERHRWIAAFAKTVWAVKPQMFRTSFPVAQMIVIAWVTVSFFLPLCAAVVFAQSGQWDIAILAPGLMIPQMPGAILPVQSVKYIAGSTHAAAKPPIKLPTNLTPTAGGCLPSPLEFFSGHDR